MTHAPQCSHCWFSCEMSCFLFLLLFSWLLCVLIIFKENRPLHLALPFQMCLKNKPLSLTLLSFIILLLSTANDDAYEESSSCFVVVLVLEGINHFPEGYWKCHFVMVLNCSHCHYHNHFLLLLL